MNVAFNHFFEARLIDGQNTLLKTLNFFRDNIDAGDRVTHIGKTGTGHQSYITCSNNTDICHAITPLH